MSEKITEKPAKKQPWLKRCPFCGAKAHIWQTNYCVFVECEKYSPVDHQVMVRGKTEREAVEKWNRRTGDDNN